MTDFTPEVAALPSPVVTALTAIFRHLFTLAAGVLVTDGILTQKGSVEFVDVALSLGLGAIGFGWAQWERAHNHATAVAAVKAAASS